MPSRVHRVVLTSLVALLVLPGAALARDGGDDRGDRNDSRARVTAVCGGGARAELRLRADDGEIRVEFELKRRARERWNVVLVQEHQVVWRGKPRTGSSDRSLRIRRSIPDLPGADEVRVRALGPRGISCEAAAVLSG